MIALDRRVRPVRRAERVVHVEIGQRRRAPSRTPDRSFPPRRGTAGSRAARRRPGVRAPRRPPRSPRRRRSRRRTSTGRPSSSASRRRDRLRLNRGSACPSAGRDGSRGSTVAPLLERVADGRQRRADARVVADHAVLQRHVEVDADEHALALQVEVADRELRHTVAVD